MHRPLLRRLACAALVVASTAPFASAQLGSLTPPPGAITETMKPLDVVEARTPVGPDTTPGDAQNVYIIDEPGSYYLTEDLIGVPGDNGILITSPGVTLDLNGFSVLGGPLEFGGFASVVPDAGATQGPTRDTRGVILTPAENTGTGILVQAFQSGVTITNGTVARWAEDGIGFFVDAGAVTNVNLIANGRWGIDAINSFAGRIDDCRFYLNRPLVVREASRGDSLDSGALRTGEGAVVTDCVSVADGNGFVLSTTSSISNSTVYNAGNVSFAAVGPSVRIVDCNLLTQIATSSTDAVRFTPIASDGVMRGGTITFATAFPGLSTSAAVRLQSDRVVVENVQINRAYNAFVVDGSDCVCKDNTIIDPQNAAFFVQSTAFRTLIDSNRIDRAGTFAPFELVADRDTTVIRNILTGSSNSLASGTGGNNIAPFARVTDANPSPFANLFRLNAPPPAEAP